LAKEHVDIQYIVDDKDLNVNDFLDLVQRVWSGNYNKELADQAIKCTRNITAWDNGELVGCVRILTDGYFFGTIPEILVRPDYQKTGIGKKLMELAWEFSPTSLFFGAQAGNEAFFEKLGYTKSLQSYQKRKPRKGAIE
jgi:ribosomal protein S18 acetylase RimI-like enzyme